MNEKEIKRTIFWDMDLNGYEKNILKNAGFVNPEHFLDMPVAYLVALNGFGFSCTCDLLAALCEYFDLPQGEFACLLKDMNEYFEELGYEKTEYELSYDAQMYINVCDIFYTHGFDTDEKISRMTIGDVLSIPGVDGEIASYCADEIMKTYYHTFRTPKENFLTVRDLINNGETIFSEKRK